jgi:glycerol-3-phosphate dehydrogenase
MDLTQQQWDLIIIGGGITGAGILREAARAGLRVLLLEQKDFAWGTSSRSSKLVHGGLRYLKEGQIGLTYASVKERQQLLSQAPGLVEPLGFLLAAYRSDKHGRWLYRAGLTVYDLLALQWSHRYYEPRDFRMLSPHLSTEGLKGGFHYGDAQTDDARLVLRVIEEAVADGATACNYRAVSHLRRDDSGRVIGVTVTNEAGTETAALEAHLVINATGAWADRLHPQADVHIRPLRGSHLIFPDWRLPMAQAITFLHPLDGRSVFIFPWEGVTLVGTTDVDHSGDLNQEPAITPDEVAYLMAAVDSQFPGLNLSLDDVISSFAGVRPVLGTGKANPSDESRDHVVWQEPGLITVTGGKLTTYRLIALDALQTAVSDLPPTAAEALQQLDTEAPMLCPAPPLRELPATPTPLEEMALRRLAGWYGEKTADLLRTATRDDLQPISNSPYLWAELRWAARHGQVVHLDDLLLRRVRLGLLLPEGGHRWLPRIRAVCQPELGWEDARWQEEEARYLALWQRHYSLPARALIPDWRQHLAAAQAQRQAAAPTPYASYRTAGWLLLAAAVLLFFYWRRYDTA